MSTVEVLASPVPVRLSAWGILSGTVAALREIAPYLAAPLLFPVVTGVLILSLSTKWWIGFFALIPFAQIGVTIHRLVAFGPAGLPQRFGCFLTSRELRYAAALYLLSTVPGMMMIAIVLPLIILKGILPDSFLLPAGWILSVPILLVVSWLAGRLGQILVSMGVGRPSTLTLTSKIKCYEMEWTAGNGWPITWAVGALGLLVPFYYLGMVFTVGVLVAPSNEKMAQAVVFVISLPPGIVFATMLTVIYRQLGYPGGVGFREGELLDRYLRPKDVGEP